MTEEKRRVSFKVFSLDEEPNIIEQLEKIAREEDRTLSQVFRQAFRFYLAGRPGGADQPPVADPPAVDTVASH